MRNQNVNPQFRVSPDATVSVHADGIIVLHLAQGHLYALNGTAARIWRGIEQRLSLDAIADQAAREFPIAAAAAREHTVRFLADLERHALVVRGVAS
ncbi:MAG TPA: PqqD family protein [Candidatus Solibacter sp.]|nr:PqqD family protein [Candidatus Solibacter sp.]